MVRKLAEGAPAPTEESDDKCWNYILSTIRQDIIGI